MVRLLTALAGFGVLSITAAPIVLAETPQGQSVDSPVGQALPATPASSPEPSDHVDSSRLPWQSPTSEAVEAGLASPYALSATVVPGRTWARAVAGYDSAAQSFRVSSAAEARLAGRLVLRVHFDHGPSVSATDRVSFGFRLQLLDQNAHGLDLGAGLFYQPNDFRREGNVVAALMLERRWGKVAVLGNALFGSDPEGDDQELDGRLGTLVRINRVVEIGLDGRFRFVLSTDGKRVGTTLVDWELAVLPGAVVMVGPFVLIGQAGFSALHEAYSAGQPDEHKRLRAGALLMSGVGAAF
jgi:hypothetical protein